MSPSRSGPFAAGDSVLFIDRKRREYLKRLKPGARIPLHGGFVHADAIIGLPDGSSARSTANDGFLVLRPTYARLIPHLPRIAQVIYPKDVGMILVWADVFPGAVVLEAGVGPGALTIALLRAVGAEG